MTLEGWIALAIYVGGIFVFFASQAADRRQMDRDRRAIEAMLAEMRRCNDEFAEAMALVEYGALAEAQEVATRWRRRAIDPKEISAALGGAGIPRVGSISIHRGEAR